MAISPFRAPYCVLAVAVSAANGQAAAPDEIVTVTGRAADPSATVAGFSDTPLARAPFQALTLSQAGLIDSGVVTLGNITRLDASIGDAYNAPGYWASMRVRGYALDNRANYRRDGLPINAETALLLNNKDRVELLQGISGAQAGVSSPGGLVNLVVKRPRADVTTLSWGLSDGGSQQWAVDMDRRLGAEGTSGLRFNLSAETLHPLLRGASGSRYLAAAAGQAHLDRDGLLEAEVEISHQSQPSVAAFSLLGNTLPSARAINPRINLNDQPWSQPVVFDGTTASLRWTQTLNADWRLVAHAMSQQLRTDDRIAFPYGCGAEDHYDRYCSDGSFDLYDYRSEGEHRQTDSAMARLEGPFDTGIVHHQMSVGVLASRFTGRFGMQANNYAGTGTLDGLTFVPAAPQALFPNTDRSERSTEVQWMDQMHLGDAGAWLGLRHTQLSRTSVGTDGSQPTAYQQSFTTPWLAATWQLSSVDLFYLSWGQGVETLVVPNRPIYTNAGQPLPALKSHQTEIGVKHDGPNLGWSMAAFDIQRPLAADQGPCDVDLSCTLGVDGTDHHLGVEGSVDLRQGAWTLHTSALWLRARREGSTDASQNGRVPDNVAQRTARLQLGYQVAGVPGLSLHSHLSYEGPRDALPDDSIGISGWFNTGLSVRYALRADGRDWLLRAGVDNLFDRRAWQESPYQYAHVYLYPLSPRSFRVSVQVSL